MNERIIVDGVERGFPLPLTLPQSIQINDGPWTTVKETIAARSQCHLESLYKQWRDADR
jgi:hypothetical protein